MNAAVRSPLLGFLVVLMLVLGLERLVVTDAEEIEELAAQAAQAIREQAWERLTGLLHEDFEYEGRDRARTVEHVRSLMLKYRPTDIGIAVFEIRVDGEEAQAQGVVRGSALGRPARVPIDAWFRETPEGWRLWKVRGGSYVR